MSLAERDDGTDIWGIPPTKFKPEHLVTDSHPKAMTRRLKVIELTLER